MKRTTLAIVALVLSLYSSLILGGSVYAAEPELLITEVKIKNTSAVVTDEFIELFNNSSQAIQLDGYYLEYFNVADPVGAVATTHKGPFALPGIELSPNTFIVFAVTPSMVQGSVQLSEITSLKDSEGSIRLLTKDQTTQDYLLIDDLSWKDSTQLPPGVTRVPTNTTVSLQKITKSDDVPVILETDWVDRAINPGSMSVEIPEVEPVVEPETPPETPTEEPVVDPVVTPPLDATPIDTPSPPAAASTVLPLRITELLPNPMAPLSDSIDEFVEIYNPNNEPVDLAGYRIETGSNFTYGHEFSSLTIAPLSYMTVTSGETSISLANTSGKARLLAPDGTVVSEADAYSDAPEGQSWVYINGVWQWTTTPTAAAPNALTAVIVVPKVSKTTTAKKSAATTTKKVASTPKAKTAATKAASSTKKAAVASAEREAYEDPELVEVSPVHPGIIALVGALTVGYAIYEYRYDMLNRFEQFKRYREARSQRRP